MTTHPWQAALTRWSDPTFKLALLLADDQRRAEQLTATACIHGLAHPTDPETACFAALFKQPQPRWRVPRWRAQHALPPELRDVPALERSVLGAWLLLGVDGSRLPVLTGVPAATLLARVGTALLLLDPDDPAHTDPDQRRAFDVWLAQQLGLPHAQGDRSTLQQPTRNTQRWQALLATAHDLLYRAVGKQRLSQATLDLIHGQLIERQEAQQTHWWQRGAVWIGVVIAGVAGLLLLLVAPWESAASPTSATAPINAQQMVQQAIDGWNTGPISGTLHRQVWAVQNDRRNTPTVTDVWLAAGSAAHRIEVRQDATLVEWQVGDGQRRLEYAADSSFSSCVWDQGTSTLDRLARTFTIPPEQQQTVRDARLTQGAYGRGYLALQQAISSRDLRSFGTRGTGQNRRILLAYTDQDARQSRRVLLTLDPQTHELYAVQTLSEVGGQTITSDLWRLEQRETSSAVLSSRRPRWSGAVLERDQLFDPTCPALDPDHVLSLRTLLNIDAGWSWYLPTVLPAGTTRAALISAGIVTPTTDAASMMMSTPGSTRAVFVGPGKWLNLRPSHIGRNIPSDQRHGNWRLALSTSRPPDVLRGSLCPVASPDNDLCWPAIDFAARGMTEDEFLQVVDSLAPVTPQTWLTLDEMFIDPRPLQADVKRVLISAHAALQPQTGTLYTATERRVRVDPGLPTWDDPYHVPLRDMYPERYTVEQWQTYADQQLTGASEVRRYADGRIWRARFNNAQTIGEYDRIDAFGTIATTEPADAPIIAEPTPALRMISDLFGTTLPIKLTRQPDAWLLEQEVEQWDPLMTTPLFEPWLGDLPPGKLIRRTSIDRVTARPRQTETIHLDAQGNATWISTTTITAWDWSDTAQTNEMLGFPPLPDDAIVFDDRQHRAAAVLGNTVNLGMPRRALVWPTTDGITTIQDSKPERSGAAIDPADDPRVRQALRMPLPELSALGLVRTTTYAMPPGDWQVTIEQGSPDLMRTMLRHNQFGPWSLQPSTRRSKAMSLTIAGQPRTGWLIEANGVAALIVQVDDVLLYITSRDAPNLEGTITAKLSELQWTDLNVRLLDPRLRANARAGG